jgi:hypothetical protein
VYLRFGLGCGPASCWPAEAVAIALLGTAFEEEATAETGAGLTGVAAGVGSDGRAGTLEEEDDADGRRRSSERRSECCGTESENGGVDWC